MKPGIAWKLPFMQLDTASEASVPYNTSMNLSFCQSSVVNQSVAKLLWHIKGGNTHTVSAVCGSLSMHLNAIIFKVQSQAAFSWQRSAALVSTAIQPCLILKITVCATSPCWEIHGREDRFPSGGCLLKWIRVAIGGIVCSKCQLSILLPEGKRVIKRQLYSGPFTLREASSFIFRFRYWW